MAMRSRMSNIGNQPRQIMRQAYENLKPKSEWKYEDDATILLVYLPGFLKEQIKVMYTYVNNVNLSIKVEGRRPLGLATGRWSQFSELYRIPETCDINNIKSEFKRGVLTIIMPKFKAESNPEIAGTSSGALDEQRGEKGKDVEAPRPQEVTTTSEQLKLQEETLDEKSQMSQVDDASAKADTVEQTKEQKSSAATEKKEKQSGDDDDLQVKRRRDDSMADKEETEAGVPGEEKQMLLLNMGTAVLVIMALGAYLSYTVRS